MTPDDQLKKMTLDWDYRARKNARHFIATAKESWSNAEFFASGEQTVENFIRNDMQNIQGGKEVKQMAVLEIGCGAGRVTRALANLFGEVHAVDISSEMIALAKEALRDCPNAYAYQNNGKDLSVLPKIDFDFAFSSLVFQHIPSYEVINSYIGEVARVLRPGALFKFQVQGDETLTAEPTNTWVGAGCSEARMRQSATANGFEMLYHHGAGTQDYWLWFFRI